ncbi:hypothetical protein GCM10007877_38810 [Marinibactrum halimedae]|uniref:Type 4 fimbrial biogenesis protein PilX N-terminal domain-containing protein n=2 Tax=Marinibactrum halimedae TaxID=1444977 RepID=A0AA37WR80_9GAMM|nr:hypothetical protein GCM10007877_38810 [Marinibactrum halimedae]
MNSNFSKSNQRGATLIVCMILLLIITVIGSSMVRDVGMQTSMVRNSQLSKAAFNQANSEINAYFANGDKVWEDIDDLLSDENLTVKEYSEELEDKPLSADETDAFSQSSRVEVIVDKSTGKPLTSVCASGFPVQNGCYQFIMTSEASIDGTGSRSRQVVTFTHISATSI